MDKFNRFFKKNKLSKKLIIFCLLGVLAFFNKNFTDDSDISKDFSTNKEEDFYQKAKVTKVIDGDTIKVDIDGEIYKVRFIGINCPEIGENEEFFGKEAKEFTKEKLYDREIFLQKDVSETDKYGRLLRYVWLEKPKDLNNPSKDEIRDSSINGILVREGYAKANYYPPDTSYTKFLKEIEKQAKKENLSMWNEKQRFEWEDLNPKR
ncbi:thermonuclease family protein [Anaerococcus sp. Marseille-P9784]|uniref:thermonuclease family protein n=1 Tax=Anaerococcus sp. Marseille-P9784 TaxID=2614127 RepID=UPI00124A04CE|nr:thermonuclease family protein [Anaerococcus sp. Marseille-P9784]